MLGLIPRLVGSLVLVLWGAAQIVPMRRMTRALGNLSPENRRVVSSRWIAEGLALIAVGAVEGLVTTHGILGGGLENRIALASEGLLVALALLDLATKARSARLAAPLSGDRDPRGRSVHRLHRRLRLGGAIGRNVRSHRSPAIMGATWPS